MGAAGAGEGVFCGSAVATGAGSAGLASWGSVPIGLADVSAGGGSESACSRGGAVGAAGFGSLFAIVAGTGAGSFSAVPTGGDGGGTFETSGDACTADGPDAV
jgi:hypothetical protein